MNIIIRTILVISASLGGYAYNLYQGSTITEASLKTIIVILSMIYIDRE